MVNKNEEVFNLDSESNRNSSIFSWISVADSVVKENYEYIPPPETPVLYYKDIDVVVIENKKYNHWGKVKSYTQVITVKSEEYGLEETFTYRGSGMFINMPYWSVEEGDIIKAELHSWKIESTGEIIKRKISNLE